MQQRQKITSLSAQRPKWHSLDTISTTSRALTSLNLSILRRGQLHVQSEGISVQEDQDFKNLAVSHLIPVENKQLF